jgi:outer membrane protein TolC
MLLITNFNLGQEKSKVIIINQYSSLDDLLYYGFQNSPALKAGFSRWKAALENVSQAGVLPDPKLTFAYFLKEVETRVGPQQSKIGIMQKFPWFGKRKLKQNAAVEVASSEKQNFRNIKLLLSYTIKKYYYRFIFIRQKITILKKNIELLKYFEEVVKAKYQSGTADYNDLVKVRIEEKLLHNKLRSVKDSLAPAESKLNAVLNRPPGALLPEWQSIHVFDITYGLKQLSIWVLSNSPSLQALEYKYRASEIRIKLAKKNYYPDISLGLDYIITGDSLPGGSLRNDPVIVMAQINLPLNFSKIKAQVNQAGYYANMINQQKKEQKNALLSRLETVYYGYKDAGETADVYTESLIPLAKQSVNIVQSAYETNKADILSLIDSQRTLLGLELEYKRSIRERAEKSAELSMLAGKDLNRENENEKKN